MDIVKIICTVLFASMFLSVLIIYLLFAVGKKSEDEINDVLKEKKDDFK